MISAKVVADSVCEFSGNRITTFELVMPKPMLAQFNKHNLIRNSAESSRARPTKSVMDQVRNDPYRPEQWQYRQSGMQPAGPMTEADSGKMDDLERGLREIVLYTISEMAKLGASKEDINRYLEPWMFATVVATGTTFQNYWKLRLHGDAQAAHRMLAEAMFLAYKESEPVVRNLGRYNDSPSIMIHEWHLPYVDDQEREGGIDPILLPLISAARVGRASYARAGETRGIEADVDRALSFVADGHWTPLEGPARIASNPEIMYGAYQGWLPLRKHYKGESGTTGLGCQADILPWAFRGPIEMKGQ